jgi:transposase
MVNGIAVVGKLDRFAAPPWSNESEHWQALDQRLPVEHLARRVARAVEMLDLRPLWNSYYGVGKKALRPDLLLTLVLYEMQNKRPSPAQWTKDVRECEPVRWLLFGMEPSRAQLYDFRDRVAPFLEEWTAQVVQWAIEEDMTSASRAALDSSSIAANASRRRLLNEERLQKRREAIDERLQNLQRGETSAEKPDWLAETEEGLREQKRRYEHAAEVMQKRQEANAQGRDSPPSPRPPLIGKGLRQL